MFDIVFGLLAKNCAANLKKNIERIETVRSHFPASAVVAVENDSSDGTLNVLREWAASSPDVKIDTFHLMSFSSSSHGKYSPRIERMVYLRNRLLEDIEGLGGARFIVLIDPDVLSFDPDAVSSVLKNVEEDTGAVFSNAFRMVSFGKKSLRLERQYDVFAYLALDEKIEDLKKLLQSSFYRQKEFIRAIRMDKKIREEGRLYCRSAFGAVAIYRWEAIKGLAYRTETLANGWALCEHVCFNDAVCERGFRCYVEGKMRVIYSFRRIGLFKYLNYKFFREV